MEDNWCHYSGMPSPKSYIKEEKKSVKEGDWVEYDGKRKKCFGIHINGNILIKMNGNLVQVHPEKIS